MLRISKKSQYGLRAMVCLARAQGKIHPLKVISEKEGVPFDYLEKIFSKLEKANLVKAKKGVRGGYFLCQKPSRIKLGRLIRALEGEMALVECIAREKKYFCPRGKKCLTKNFWKKIQDVLNYALNSITLADLIKK